MAVSVWLGERDHPLKSEVVVDGSERGSATYGDGFKGEHRVSPAGRTANPKIPCGRQPMLLT